MGRGKRTQRAQTASLPGGVSAPGALVATGQKVCRQPFAETPVAGYGLERTWAMKVEATPETAALARAVREAFPALAERIPLPAAEGYLHFQNEKARWFYANAPGEVRWEHESASEYVLNVEHRCFLHSIDRGGVHCVWYRYPSGEQIYYEGPHDEEELILEIDPTGVVYTADGWLRRRDRSGRPQAGPDGATDVHRDGTREWRAARGGATERLPHEPYPLHREDGPAVVHPDGSDEHWLEGKRVG